MGIALEICNKVMSEVQGIKDTGFPLDAFPERVQTIILDMVRYENFRWSISLLPCSRQFLPLWEGHTMLG